MSSSLPLVPPTGWAHLEATWSPNLRAVASMHLRVRRAGLRASKQMTGTDGHEARLLSLRRVHPGGQRATEPRWTHYGEASGPQYDPESPSDHLLLTPRNIHSDETHLMSCYIKKTKRKQNQNNHLADQTWRSLNIISLYENCKETWIIYRQCWSTEAKPRVTWDQYGVILIIPWDHTKGSACF